MDPISIALGLAQFAPMLLRYLGVGDKGVDAAEKAIDIAKEVTGTSSGQAALEVFKADPTKAYEFKAAILNANTDLEKAYLLDKASARDRDKAFITSGQKNIRGDVLAYMAIVALVSLIIMLFFRGDDMPLSVKDLLLVLSGSLVAIVKDVYSFEFGTTRTSKVKDETISNLSGKS